MRSIFIGIVFATSMIGHCNAQAVANNSGKGPVWTEGDRQYLLDNLVRTKQEIINETSRLSAKQWDFKESPDRWNINQIVEHIAIWELLFMREISVALMKEADSDFAHIVPDSVFLGDPTGRRRNNALEYTKPFSFAVPLGNNEGKNNVTWLMTMRNESIEFLKGQTRNLRQHYDCFGSNVHQYYLMIFSHADNHLRQIRRVKAHKDYPRN